MVARTLFLQIHTRLVVTIVWDRYQADDAWPFACAIVVFLRCPVSYFVSVVMNRVSISPVVVFLHQGTLAVQLKE